MGDHVFLEGRGDGVDGGKHKKKKKKKRQLIEIEMVILIFRW